MSKVYAMEWPIKVFTQPTWYYRNTLTGRCEKTPIGPVAVYNILRRNRQYQDITYYEDVNVMIIRSTNTYAFFPTKRICETFEE